MQGNKSYLDKFWFFEANSKGTVKYSQIFLQIEVCKVKVVLIFKCPNWQKLLKTMLLSIKKTITCVTQPIIQKLGNLVKLVELQK
jgi:hypothetical protein